ncbi:uncharacterized protein LOC143270116 [Peromyscus maniculatus bairdii]|uniref:uncharacterized protein LOC143270116 n=1 Tax=Peromyscus maniculatus bairdii TaxID=230844 RepID=UPI003FD60475
MAGPRRCARPSARPPVRPCARAPVRPPARPLARSLAPASRRSLALCRRATPRMGMQRRARPSAARGRSRRAGRGRGRSLAAAPPTAWRPAHPPAQPAPNQRAPASAAPLLRAGGSEREGGGRVYTRGEGPRLDRDGRPRASASRASRCGGVGGGRVKAALPPPAARFLSREWWAPSPPFPSPGRDGRPDKEGRGLGGMLALEEEVGNKQTKKRQLGGWELHGDAPRGHPPPLPKKKKCLCLPCCPKLRKSGWASLPPGPDDDARSHRASSPVSGERGRTWAATPVKATGGASSQGPASSEERLRAVIFREAVDSAVYVMFIPGARCQDRSQKPRLIASSNSLLMENVSSYWSLDASERALKIVPFGVVEVSSKDRLEDK